MPGFIQIPSTLKRDSRHPDARRLAPFNVKDDSSQIFISLTVFLRILRERPNTSLKSSETLMYKWLKAVRCYSNRYLRGNPTPNSTPNSEVNLILQVEDGLWAHAEKEVEDGEVGLETMFVGEDLIIRSLFPTSPKRGRSCE